MKPVDIVAVGAVSGLGVGRAAFDVGSAGAPARTAIQRDSELDAAGLRRPFCARVEGVESGERDRARQLLLVAARGLCAELDQRLPRWRERRIGLCIGTSGGGMPSQVRAFERRAAGEPLSEELARAAPYFGPLSVLPEALGARAELTVQVLAACASSTVAIGLGCRWLELERADLVIAGGYDAMSVFIAAGFEALGATSATLPAPFRCERDGMALGEGAALVALTRTAETGAPVLGHVLGFAASSDAVHITAPDRTGAGLARAARGALRDAGMAGGDVDIVSAHATATPFNDAAEASAISAVLESDARRAVVHPFKAVIGHTLGAAGALELLSALDAIGREVLPAAAGSGAIEPALTARLLERNTEGKAKFCLKLSAAFGGANAALAAGRAKSSGTVLARRPVRLLAVGLPQERFDRELVTRVSALEAQKLARLDALSELAVSAAASAVERWGRSLPDTAAVVVGSAAATIEINDAYDQRRRERGARFVEPRRFPPTSPNLAGGQCSIAFGLHGLSLAVGAGLGAPTEALLVGCDLVEAGDADVVLVVAAEQVGDAVRDIWRAAGWPVPRHGAAAVLLGADGGQPFDRGRLAGAHAQVSAEQGRLGAAEPGWPVLLGAVELGRGSGA